MKTCNIADYQKKHSQGLRLIENELKILIHLEDEQVKHPHISRFYFAFHDATFLYLTFELQTCGDMRYHLKRHGTTFTEKGVAFLAICIADALRHLHSRGILHRDVKPENILLDEFGRPSLTDFGVSYLSKDRKAGDAELICNLGSGTREYMAPEVLSKTRRHGVEADFWSLGVVLYELLHRVRPYERRCPGRFVQLINFFHTHDVRLSSTGSYQRSSEGDSGGLGRGSDEDRNYEFSTRAHEDYVAAAVVDNPVLALKLKELRVQALKERCEVESSFMSRGGGDSTPSDGQVETYTNTTGSDNTEDSSRDEPAPIAAHSQTKPLVDLSLELPASLRVYKGISSSHCADVLGRLLDVRVWRRLGAGANLGSLQRHGWLKYHGLKWHDVVAGRVQSPLAIDKNNLNVDFVSKYLFGDEVDDIVPSSIPYKGERTELSEEDKRILEDFYYWSPEFGGAGRRGNRTRLGSGEGSQLWKEGDSGRKESDISAEAAAAAAAAALRKVQIGDTIMKPRRKKVTGGRDANYGTSASTKGATSMISFSVASEAEEGVGGESQ